MLSTRSWIVLACCGLTGAQDKSPEARPDSIFVQSTFNTPRWTTFTEQAGAIRLARMYLKARRKEYNAERIGRNREHALKYGRQDKHTH